MCTCPASHPPAPVLLSLCGGHDEPHAGLAPDGWIPDSSALLNSGSAKVHAAPAPGSSHQLC